MVLNFGCSYAVKFYNIVVKYGKSATYAVKVYVIETSNLLYYGCGLQYKTKYMHIYIPMNGYIV